MDVDGTLTDGKIYTSIQGEIMKAFSIKDGYGIKEILPKYNISPVIITGRESRILSIRCEELMIKDVYQGILDKKAVLENIVKKKGVTFGEVAYIGDDLNDLSCMRIIKNAGGIVGCPKDSDKTIQDLSQFISQYNGGQGAVRDFINYICNIEKGM